MNRRSLLLAGAAILSATSVSAQANTLTGAGATFPAPLYHRWAQSAQNEVGITVNYQSIGSGAGINQITNRTVDFGATDAPLTVERLKQLNLVQIPTVMGSLVISYNVPGVANGALRLTPQVLGAIYAGGITMWNDPLIAAINPGLNLPRIPIVPMYRADGSGTTWVFTQYLSKALSGWRDTVGAGTSVRWPAGQGARGNEGVSASISRVRGAIGYIESSYAVINKLPTAQLQNKNGQFVLATKENVQNTARAASFKEENGFVPDLLDQAGDNVWPIVGATYLLIPTNPTEKIKSENIIKFVEWFYSKGDAAAEQLHYVPLPSEVKTALLGMLRNTLR